MGVNIHPQAIVDPKAELGTDVVVGPFAMVGPLAKIGDRTEIMHHATVEGKVSMGAQNRVFPTP